VVTADDHRIPGFSGELGKAFFSGKVFQCLTYQCCGISGWRQLGVESSQIILLRQLTATESPAAFNGNVDHIYTLTD
jgi:hypothetical protein